MNPSSKFAEPLSVCLVHDWLVAMRGGEKVLEAIGEIFPDAPIYTLFLDREKLSPKLKNRTIHVSFLQYVPGILKIYRWLLPLFPFAIRSFNLKPYDLVISSSHCVAKSVRVRKDALHICYCHAPIRYAWDLTDDYLRSVPPFFGFLIRLYFKWLRKWDYKTAQTVTYFIGNSDHVSAKIKKHYERDAVTIHPALDLKGSDHFKHGSYYLVLGALVPYKRVDLTIEAFNRLKRPLKIIGDGPSRNRLEKMVRHSEIQLEGWLDDHDLPQCYENARALIFPGEEDFGIVPLEAQAFGKPVIAFGKGGVKETVLPHRGGSNRDARTVTGVFFDEQTVDALINAVQFFETLEFDPAFIRQHVKNFGRDRFIREFRSFIDSVSHSR